MSERDATEDALRDAAHDAFMAFWRSTECEHAALWATYCAAQTRYEAYLMRAVKRWLLLRELLPSV